MLMNRSTKTRTTPLDDAQVTNESKFLEEEKHLHEKNILDEKEVEEVIEQIIKIAQGYQDKNEQELIRLELHGFALNLCKKTTKHLSVSTLLSKEHPSLQSPTSMVFIR